MDKKLFSGAGGGGGQSPVNTPDSLFSEDTVEFILAVSEGPIRGLTQGAKTFSVGGTPLVSTDGTRNFEKFAIGIHPGYPEGEASEIKMLLGGTSSSTQVALSLQKDVPVVRQTDPVLRGTIDQLEARINIQRALFTDNSGTYKTDVIFDLEYKKASDSAWSPFYSTTQITLNGKTTGGVVKEFRVSVPRISDDDWQIRVTKRNADYVPPDSGDDSAQTIVDIAWDSFQCLTSENPTYPNTAVIHGIGTANGQFSSIPEFSGVYDGMLILIPTNYNPDTRTYDESVPWNGSFKLGWCNNNAWWLYNLIVNTRWGLAKYRRYIDANRFTFYEAAKWCDEQVLINGGPETRPRYTLNMWLTEPRPAMEMLTYVAGSFNALIWDDLRGQIHLKVDKDDPAVQLFTPENITEEGFSYTFTDMTARANDITVHFINPDLDWTEDVRRIPNVTTNEAAIQKYGRVPLDFTAVGCTNIHEAVTKAQVRLISAQTETKMVRFTSARQAVMLELYEVILVADPLMGWSEPRRLTSYDSQYMYFRDPIYIETLTNYTAKFQTVEGIVEVVVTPEETGNVTKFKLTQPLPDNLPRYCVFTIEDTTSYGLAKPFRVMSIEESDDGYMFKITAIEINRQKYVQAENVTDLSTVQYSYKAPGLPGAISTLNAESGDNYLEVLGDGTVLPRIFVSWTRPFAQVIDHYRIQWQQTDTEDWKEVISTVTSCFLAPVVAGKSYSIRVASVTAGGETSEWVTLDGYIAQGKSKVPAVTTSFFAVGDLFQNHLYWTYSGAVDLRKVEIYSSKTDDIATAVRVSEVAYPGTTWVHVGLNAGETWYYWIRVMDTSSNYSLFSSSVSATTESSATKILSVLSDALTESQLSFDLNSRLNLIDGSDALPGSVAYRILQEANARGAAITNEQTIRQTADDSFTQSIQTLTASVGDNAAAIQTEIQNRTDSETAISQRIDTLTSSVGANTATIQSQTTTLNGVLAEYTLKTDVNGNIAGFGLINDGATSQFIVNADTFAVAFPGELNKYPFIVGQVNGQSVVGIDGALVISGSLSAISANMGTITAGKMQSTDGKFVIDLDSKTISITV